MESSEYVRIFSLGLIDFKRKSLESEFGCDESERRWWKRKRKS